MKSRTPWWGNLVGIFGLLVLGGQALGVAPEIKDEGKFFSPDALKKANAEIRDIARQYQKDLLVETFQTVPADQAEKIKTASAEEKSRFFQSWAKERAEQAVVNGVYILICRNPPHLQVITTGGGSLGAQFSNQLRDLLIREFKEKRFDEGLLAAVKRVRENLNSGKTKN